jgi:hypothetical protein
VQAIDHSIFISCEPDNEIGHLQIINPESKDFRRKFAVETKAQEFADFWRKRLWEEHFEHPDPVHNAPGADELACVFESSWEETVDPNSGSVV